MRARLGIARAGLQVELREILLRDKAPEFLEASPKATVPVLVLPDGTVIEESLDIMDWALEGIPNEERALIQRCDAEFKPWLDRYKYSARYEDCDAEEALAKAKPFLEELDLRLADHPFLFGDARRIADIGIAPFIRQFAHVDVDWFKAQNWNYLIRWYQDFVDWDGFKSAMQASDIKDKDLILRVLDMYEDNSKREEEIRNLAATFEVIQEKILPSLRRSEITINGEMTSFSDEKITEFASSNPDTLSAEELSYAATLTDDLDKKLAIYKSFASIHTDDWRGPNNVGLVCVGLPIGMNHT